MPSQESPMQRPVTRRIDEAAADAGTLATMGHGKPPPVPVAEPLPGPSPAEQVIDVLAKLDPADVEAVTRWLQTKRSTDR